MTTDRYRNAGRVVLVTIAILAMGEMGSGIAGRFVERGARVVTSVQGRSQTSVERAKAAGVEMLADRDLIGEADIFLSVVPPASARDMAARFLTVVDTARAPVFIDCNAIAPQTLKVIAEGFADRGLRFIDGSIIGAAPRADGYSPRLYLSGPTDNEADTIGALGIETRVLSSILGEASALKMAYAGIGKGFQALGTAMALGAARAGVTDHLVAELADSQPELYAWLRKMQPTMYAKAYRWDGEMLEISAFLEPERGAADMFGGAAALYRHVAEDHRIGADSEIISILEAFTSPSV